jgi:CYTH domain-containing protein
MFTINKIMRRQEFINYALVIGLMVVMSCSTAAGVGVIPPSFSVADAQRGEEYEHIITVVNSADGDIDCELNAIGPGSEWITFYRAGDPLTPLETYLFCWDKVPGEDSDRLLQSLKAVLNIGWAEEAEINKSRDNMTIRVFTHNQKAVITLDEQHGTATLEASGGRIHDLPVKEENDQLNVYVSSVHIKGVYIFTWSNVPGKESEELLKFLRDELSFGWAGNAEIAKSVDNRTIRVFKGGNSAEITLANCQKATLTTDGKTIDLRVKEEDGELKICKANSGKERILVKIKIADDAENEDYNFTIYVKPIPPETTAVFGAVAYTVVRMPVTAAIQVTGEQILNGTVKSISAANTEIGYPLKITVAFQNDGNVVARPAISGCVIKSGGTNNGTVIDTFVHAETGIRPYKTGTITVLWNTTGHEPGDYKVSVNVSLAGELIIATKVLPVTILPRGALTRKGELNLLYMEGEPQVNRLIKVVAEFENTGMIDTL